MIGIIPCAGHATRLHGLPKYLLPVRNTYLLKWHIDAMRFAGCDHVIVGTNPDNDDLIFDYADGSYPIKAENYETMTQTVQSMRRECGDQSILFGMPDTYWSSDEAVYGSLKSNLDWDGGIASIALWLVLPEFRNKRGMVKHEDYGDMQRILQVIDKPQNTELRWGWGAIAWKPAFWQYLKPQDPHVGYALQRAIEAGELITGSMFTEGFYDCGTPDEYFACIRDTTGETLYATD